MASDKPSLFAVAYERYRKIQRGKYRLVKADIEYLHAFNVAHAKDQFCHSNPNRRTHKVVAVGPVIGYFCDDKGKSQTV